jgi:polysaccharide chain length determinant protein (PEP-CTERM system associated)
MGSLDLQYYLSIFLKRLPYFVAIAALVTAIGVAFVYVQPAVFQATAKILVESPQIPTELARSTVPTNPVEQFQIIQEDVLSRENLVALAQRFGLYNDRKGVSPAEIADDMRARTIVEQIKFDEDSGGSPTMAFGISFKAAQATVAAEVANEIVSMILQKDVELRTGRATDTLQFFTREVDRLNGELKQVEGNILQFKNENADALPDSLAFRRNQQSTEQERLLLLAQEETSLRKRQLDLKSTGRSSDGPVTPEQKTLDDLQQSLVQQLATFSESSPGIKALRARIAALQAQTRAGAAQLNANGNTAPVSPVEVELSSIDDRLKAIADERASIGQSFEALNQSIRATPTNESTLNALERNRQNIQAQYNSAVARLAEASTGVQIESRLKGQRLSLIESAVPPQKPVSPNRLLMLIGTAVAALGVGAAAIVLMELLNRRIRRPAELIEKLEIVPLMTIPYINTSGELTRRRMTSVMVLAAAAGVIPVVLLLLHVYAIPLDVLVNKALGGLSASNGR